MATHAWDLVFGFGLSIGDEELAREALDGARAMLKPEYRNLMEQGSPFGSQLPAPPGATTWEQLAAFMGCDTRQALR